MTATLTREAAETLANTLPRADPPPLPRPPRVRTMREIVRLATNDPRYGLGAVALFVVLVLLGLDGAILPLLRLDRHLGAAAGTALGLIAHNLWGAPGMTTTPLLALERLGDLEVRQRAVP